MRLLTRLGCDIDIPCVNMESAPLHATSSTYKPPRFDRTE